MKKKMLGSMVVIIACLIGLGIWMAPTLKQFAQVQVVDYDANLKIFLGGGGNSLVLKSPDNQHVLIVDTKIGPGSKKLKTYVASLGTNPQVTIVNTHDHPDHTGGNSLFPKATIIAGDYTDDQWRKDVKGRLPDEKINPGQGKILTLGDEIVRIFNLGQAHTTNDMIVYLEKRQLIHMGDLVFVGWNPVMRLESGANSAKWIQALTYVQNNFAIKTLVPGHGPVSTSQALIDQRDYFTSIREAVGNPEQLKIIEKKYSRYFSLPGMSGFQKTVKFIQQEQNDIKEK
jgi:cyclase